MANRQQCTKVNCTISNLESISCGVPQGSVLGPKLFLVYVNDMAKYLNSVGHYLYADDAVLFHAGNDKNHVEQSLVSDLDNFGRWCKINALTINIKKTKFMCFGTSAQIKKCSNMKVSINDTCLERVQNYKYLGITLDTHLNFKKHINLCKRSCSHKVYTLSKIRRYLDTDTSLELYKTMIMPVMDYGDIIYAGASNVTLDKLQRIQNRALKICLNVNHYLPTILLHQEANVPNITARRSCHLANYIFSRKDDIDLLVVRDINTRRFDAPVLETDRPNIETYKHRTIYRGVALWNNLSVATRNIQDYSIYKQSNKTVMYNSLVI